MNSEIQNYNNSQSDEDRIICEKLMKEINLNLPQAESKIWHAHPVWFLEGNPIVGYSKQKKGIRLMFWSGKSFEEEGLNVRGEKFQDASIFYHSADEINSKDLKRWLEKSKTIQWDYKNIVKRKGVLERIMPPEIKINTIKAVLGKSDYGYPDSLNFQLDSYFLDEKLEELYPGRMFKGLVPTLLSEMDEFEKKIVWERILPKKNEHSLCPIMMCPDDCDFSCTTIIAEIVTSGNYVYWKRLGIDKTNEYEVKKIGKKVEWLNKIEEFTFLLEDYLKMIKAFKNKSQDI